MSNVTVVNWHIDLGQILTSLLLLLIGWGLRETYKLISSFINRVNDNESTLGATTKVVNRHSLSLMKAGLLDKDTVEELHMGRRSGDPTYIVLDMKEKP